MSSNPAIDDSPSAQPRRRLTRGERQRQLLDIAWQLISLEGTEALTLGRLAELAGVTKPVVYDHFGTRAGLLAVLYQDYDQRQTALMDAALSTSEPTLEGQAKVIATSYIDCVLTQGREITGVIAALASSPELERIKREYDVIFLARCQHALAGFATASTLSQAGLRAMLGAAEALSAAAAAGEIKADDARAELFETIVAMVRRNNR
ncbi:TetR/AcrR family transcriptional regulator [Pseudomonas sp. CDFA 602]|uniref:TetR/AcrR family transcriptional regulator n=1 Tax=Pseudomonas californiensis TaxID=2829823 RepID=UPI001E2BE651|nr:TetR/AcrR family transcriptional regulator [Pseudomonas californiensis]MCD5992805.1 TetR/AcrR family transcriptional regulator [Pseudomonas californiensis]MCD5998685.1 TetR/AcrR family transcriptional regulator [Pseudomonas californiensis]